MKTKLEELNKSFNAEVLKLERIKGQYEDKSKSLKNINSRLKKNEHLLENFRQINLLFEKASVISRKIIKDELEILVTRGLQSVFEDPSITFKVDFVNRRNQIEADFYLEWVNAKAGRIRGDILNTFGGGIIDIIALILRLVVLEFSNISGPLFLDEPFRMLSKDFVMNAGKFLVELSKIFNRQIIVVTHISELGDFASKTFEVFLEESESKVKRL